MSQSSLQLPTTGTLPGLTAVNDINAANSALVTLNSGNSAPTMSGTGLSGLAGVPWHDTSANQLNIRNLADSAWITLFNIDESNGVAVPPAVYHESYLGADVLLTNTAAFFDGPSLNVGSVGTWFVIAKVTLIDTGGAAAFFCKLWDGTTVFDSATATTAIPSEHLSITLSGRITNPAGPLKVSVQDPTSTSGVIEYNVSGLSKDSSIKAQRIG